MSLPSNSTQLNSFNTLYIYKGLANNSVCELAYMSLISRDKLLILDYILYLIDIL
jgi:hypothetical protein